MSDILNQLPKMLGGQELVKRLTVLPNYDTTIRNQSLPEKLIALSDIYKIYLPSEMSIEIYNKLYLSLLRSLQKKYTKLAIRQQSENFKAICQQEYESIIGGSDSFTIIGVSGIGKSSAISRAVNLITDNRIIKTLNPYNKIIPCVTVQCPWDASVKGLLLEILRKVDDLLCSNHYKNAVRMRATIDMLIGSVSQVALNHIGMIIIDEIQNVCNSKNGKNLVGTLTQLINNSGISIAMVGTPESSIFFEQALQLARRSIGLEYSSLTYDDYFYTLCQILFSYQYTTDVCKLNDGIVKWFYEHSGGITSTVVSLYHDAQEIAITNNRDKIDIDLLNSVYKSRLKMLHGYLQRNNQRYKTTVKRTKNNTVSTSSDTTINNESIIFDTIQQAKFANQNVIKSLNKMITIEEV